MCEPGRILTNMLSPPFKDLYGLARHKSVTKFTDVGRTVERHMRHRIKKVELYVDAGLETWLKLKQQKKRGLSMHGNSTR